MKVIVDLLPASGISRPTLAISSSAKPRSEEVEMNTMFEVYNTRTRATRQGLINSVQSHEQVVLDKTNYMVFGIRQCLPVPPTA